MKQGFSLNPNEPTCVQMARMGTLNRSTAIRDILDLWERIVRAEEELAKLKKV